MLFISEAIAQTQGAAPQPDAVSNFIPLLLIFVIFYFFLIRPQQKKIKEHNEMVGALKRGDEVVTGGGIIGKIKKLDDNILHVDIATDVTVKVMKSTVTSINPSKAEAKASKQDNKKTASK